MWLAITNLDPNEAVEIEANMPGMAARSATGQTLTGPKVDSVNTFEAPSRSCQSPFRLRSGRETTLNSNPSPSLLFPSSNDPKTVEVKDWPTHCRVEQQLVNDQRLNLLREVGLSMKNAAQILIVAIAAVATAPVLAGQVQTEVPSSSSWRKAAWRWNTSRSTGVSWRATWKGMRSTVMCSSFFHPAYKKEKSRRFPVVYALHGYSIGAEQWSHEIHVPQTIEGAFAQGDKEMIVVLPDSKTLHNGSMYSSSVTTGDFEQFVARDLVEYIDAHYRTIPNRLSRGLVGIRWEAMVRLGSA